MATIDSTDTTTPIMPPPSQLWRMNVERYHRLIESGALTPDDNIELIQGWIIEKMPHNPPYFSVIQILQYLLTKMLPDGFVLRIQGPITLVDSEPEPDVVIAKGHFTDYTRQHPDATQVDIAIEVSHATLSLDRNSKRAMYAANGIQIYWIVNVERQRIELFEQPDMKMATYNHKTTYYFDDTISVVVGGETIGEIAVADLFPS